MAGALIMKRHAISMPNNSLENQHLRPMYIQPTGLATLPLLLGCESYTVHPPLDQWPSFYAREKHSSLSLLANAQTLVTCSPTIFKVIAMFWSWNIISTMHNFFHYEWTAHYRKKRTSPRQRLTHSILSEGVCTLKYLLKGRGQVRKSWSEDKSEKPLDRVWNLIPGPAAALHFPATT